MFQCHILAELYASAGDYKFLEDIFRGPGGLVHKENFTDEDMEAWKYALSRPSQFNQPVHFSKSTVLVGRCTNSSAQLLSCCFEMLTKLIPRQPYFIMSQKCL